MEIIMQSWSSFYALPGNKVQVVADKQKASIECHLLDNLVDMVHIERRDLCRCRNKLHQGSTAVERTCLVHKTIEKINISIQETNLLLL